MSNVIISLAICMNFRSENVLQYCKKVSDHHKGWTMCRIARQSITQELIVPFVRQELVKSEPDLAVSKFLKFVMQAEDPNYTFLADFTFELLDSVFLYRAGVRCGNADFIKAGRAKYAKLSCGRHHPLYRELEVADTLFLQRMPSDMLKFVLNSPSLTMNGKPYTWEGADFRLEEINRQVQHWLPNIPSAKDWKISCCNFDKLSQLRTTVFQQMGIADPKERTSQYVQNIEEEVIAFRTKLRSAQ